MFSYEEALINVRALKPDIDNCSDYRRICF